MYVVHPDAEAAGWVLQGESAFLLKAENIKVALKNGQAVSAFRKANQSDSKPSFQRSFLNAHHMQWKKTACLAVSIFHL